MFIYNKAISTAIHRITQYKKNIFFLLVFFIFIFHALNNYLILSHDNIPVLFDERYFFEESAGYHKIFSDILFKNDFSTALNHIKHWNSKIPPLVPITTSFLYFFFGLSEDVAALSILPYLFILIFSVYKIGEKLYSPAVGLFAAFLVSFFPMIAGMSRVYYLEIPMTAMISLAFLFLLNADYFNNRKYSILLGISFALALLVKWTSVIFLTGPCIFYILRGAKKNMYVNLFLSLGIVFLLVFPAYALLGKIFLSKYSSIFLNINVCRDFSFKLSDLFIYFNYLYDYQILAFFTIVFCISIPIFLMRGKSGRGFLLLWFLFPYIFFTVLFFSGFFKSPRFSVPFLPAVSLMVSFSIFSLENKKFKFTSLTVNLLIPIIVVVSLAQFLRLSYDPGFKSQLLYNEKNHHGFGRYRAYNEDWKTKEIFFIISNRLALKAGRKIVVFPLFNNDSINSPLVLKFSSEPDKNVLFDISLWEVAGGYSSLREDEFYEKKIKKADIIMVKEGGFLGVEDRDTAAMQVYKKLGMSLEKHKGLFSLIGLFGLPDKSKLLVYERKD